MKHIADQFEIKFINHSLQKGDVVLVTPYSGDTFLEFVGEIKISYSNDVAVEPLDKINGEIPELMIVSVSRCKKLNRPQNII